jgi:hypothetical protein
MQKKGVFSKKKHKKVVAKQSDMLMYKKAVVFKSVPINGLSSA